MSITYEPTVSNKVPSTKFMRSDNPYTYHTMPFIKWLIDNPEFSNPEKVSIVYLASYQDYNGKLVAGNRVPLTKALIKVKLKMANAGRFNDFYKKLFEQGILEELKQGLYWNNDMSLKRGMYGTQKHDSVELVKIYDKQLNYLYENNAPKTLYPIVALAPHTTAYDNKIEVSLVEASFLCGYSNTRSASKQLKLMQLENGESVFAKEGSLIFINWNLLKR